MKSFKNYIAEDKSLERALQTDADKPKKKPTLPKAPWEKNEGTDTHCSDKCCGSEVKAEDCKCPPDCAHCDCNAVEEAMDPATKAAEARRAGVGRTGETARQRAVRLKQTQRESFDPKHPKVVAARKAHKAGTYNGNVDKNGNAIVHINGKPHTVTSGDPASRNEEVEQIDELSPATLKSYKKKAVKQYKQSANKRNPGGGDYGSATKAAQDKHQKRFDKRHKGIGSEIKRTTDSDIHLKDPKGLVRRDPKANSLTGKPAPYKHRAESYLDEDTINSVTAAYINEHNITLDELENMTEAELNELIGKAIGGAFKLGAKAVVGGARLAGGAGKLAGKGIKKAVYNKQGNRRGSAAAKQDTKGDNAEAKAQKAERERAQRDRIANMEKRQAAAEKDLRDKDQAIRDKKQKLNDKK